MTLEEDHSYAIRKLYGTMKDKGFIQQELTDAIVTLARKKGQWTIGRCTTEEINYLYDKVNSGIDIMKYLKEECQNKPKKQNSGPKHLKD